MSQEFEAKLQEIRQKYADEIAVHRNDLAIKFKKENGLSASQ